MGFVRFASCVLVFLFVPFAHSYELEQVLSHLSRVEKDIKGIQFDFVQNIDFKEREMISNISGHAWFEKPGKIKISRATPTEQLTISNGDRIWIYTPAYRQVWEGKITRSGVGHVLPKGLIFPMNNFLSSLQENFDLSLEESPEESAKEVTLKAVPKKSDRSYEMKMVISTQAWFPVQTVYETETAIVATTLSQWEFNPELENGLFEFKPPKGIDVIPLE